MKLAPDIILRPRFTMEFNEQPEKLLSEFEYSGATNEDFVISRIDDHVFIRFPKHKQHFWSPQLHLEIYKVEEQPSRLKGLYGPSPNVWTLFMFLHFVLVTLFIAASIWTFTNITLNEPFIYPTVALIILITLWFALYFGGRLGKQKGKEEMFKLQAFMHDILKRGQNTPL